MDLLNRYSNKQNINMKRIDNYIWMSVLIILSGILFSCEKEIDIRLDGVEKRYVVEAVVTDEEGGSKVLISQTKDFDEDNTRATVSGAIVSMSDGTNSIDLEETAPGEYTSPTWLGTPGTTYHLRVQIGDEQITASSTMPDLIRMDSLYIREELIFGEIQKLATIDFMDPFGVPNYYRFVLYVNDRKIKQIFAFNDELTDGNANSLSLYVLTEAEDDEDKIKSGDVVRVEMLTTDAAVYKYFFSLANSATGDSNSATPANPVSNLRGNALGYFSAHTIQRKEVVAP